MLLLLLVVKDLLEEDNRIIGYITGVSVYNKLGLTTQVSNTILIGTNIIRKPKKRGKEELIEEIVKVPGVGFAKAQMIIDAGYDTKTKLKKAKNSDLEALSGISEDLAKKIKKKYK